MSELRCACGERIGEPHREFFTIHESGGRPQCARCHHEPRSIGRPDVRIPAWVADEVVCLLDMADGLSDLARRTSKEIGCECGKDGIGLCIYHHAQDVLSRARQVVEWLKAAGA